MEQVSVDTTRDGLITRAVNWLMNDFVVSTPNENISPVSFNLSQNYPNPFNPTTTITYSIPKESQVNLKIYDVMGREVAVLVNGKQQAGAYEVKFDAASLASGTYFYKLTAGDFISVKKMALLK
ncbi:MAG: T9SS type A sorting domain-containing protein [Psychromonas sp.]|nr:T9SS type A sorting domain-containing protein [Psychromonas sp.]